MSESNVRITMTGHGRGEVFINGEKVQGVKAVGVAIGVESINEVTLTLLPQTIEIDGVFDVSTIESDEREHQVGNEG